MINPCVVRVNSEHLSYCLLVISYTLTYTVLRQLIFLEPNPHNNQWLYERIGKNSQGLLSGSGTVYQHTKTARQSVEREAEPWLIS